MTARAYIPEDYETVREWADARGVPMCPQILSPNGFVIEDQNGPCAVCWVYLLFDVPIAMVDNFITRPDLGPSVAAAWRLLWNKVCAFLLALKDTDGGALTYYTVRTFCSEELAPFAKREGWELGSASCRQITRTIV